jgi:hypothetical protein
MIAKHKSIARLKKYYKSQFGNDSYLREFNDFKSMWEANHKPMEMVYPEIKETKEIAIQTDPAETEPSQCINCRNREEVQIPQPRYPQCFPYQLNPFMFWNSEGQAEPNPAVMMWMNQQQQQGLSFQ